MQALLTREQTPTKIQSGLGIANGILGALSVAFPIIGVPAGIGGVISGAVGLAMADIKQFASSPMSSLCPDYLPSI